MIDKILNMMDRWDPVGQAFVILFLAILAVGFVLQAGKLVVALFRGWPPPETAAPAARPADDDDADDWEPPARPTRPTRPAPAAAR